MDRNPSRSVLRLLWLGVGVAGFAAVLLGAIGAHATGGMAPDLAATFDTASGYHLSHAIAAAVAAAIATLDHERARLSLLAGTGFLAGIVCFSGSLYAHALSGGATPTTFAPIGGAAFMASWLVLGIAGARAIKRIGS